MNKLSIKELMKNRKKKGFTLIELIIVIAIIAILAAMAIPKFSSIRMDARVSNDVAAAKNIHTIAATLVANGTWSPGEKDLDSTDVEVTSRLDGKLAANGGNSEASGNPFIITIGDDENIIITCTVGNSTDEYELYPDANGEGRKDYLSAVTGN